MRKFVAIVILVPLGAILVMFAVANRQIAAVTFEPYQSVEPAFALRMPLFVLIFVLVGLGVLIGGIAAWLRQHKWRARARRAEADARDLRARLEATRLEAERPRREAPAALEAAPPFAVPPAA
jgi:hypothetical protein